MARNGTQQRSARSQLSREERARARSDWQKGGASARGMSQPSHRGAPPPSDDDTEGDVVATQPCESYEQDQGKEEHTKSSDGQTVADTREMTLVEDVEGPAQNSLPADVSVNGGESLVDTLTSKARPSPGASR